MPPLPLSRSQIDKLGKRLAESEGARPDDVATLNELLMNRRDVLSQAVQRLQQELPHQTTSRVKTRGTTLEKLRRAGSPKLSRIQDLAGTRIVADLGRTGQDELVARVVALFSSERVAPRVIDRRLNPSSGYRAVHVVAFPGGVPVEIQVRTKWQHEWANLFEKLADRVGREIRYGGKPDLSFPEPRPLSEKAEAAWLELQEARLEHAESVVRVAHGVGDIIDLHERIEQSSDDAAIAKMRSTFDLEEELDYLRTAISEI